MLVANTTTDAFIMVYPCLSAFLYMDSFLRTVGLAATGGTSAAKVGDFVIDLYAGGTCFINHTHDVIFRRSVFCTVQCMYCIL